ncbi:hypothetical protein AOQ72_10550 [Bradyrhizobium yuanmingense]|uniref:Uncharacterized protein n=1 Tax=Bradyrhizobium yuanmingense TaxID=108015 RepID=A0A0R3CWB8_9BRAD|nr:hypothetical protein [Bradyrhizobium yuanmingense]KRQ01847.1 hypothetical protein AOQ72_10550 [Bradyrhizobium yuanmingense]
MKPVQRNELTHAVPLDGRGRRTNRTLLSIRARGTLLRMAAAYFPASSERETARRLHAALSRFHGGRWRRDRTLAVCPPQYLGSVQQIFFAIFTMHDHVPSDRVVRQALAQARR